MAKSSALIAVLTGDVLRSRKIGAAEVDVLFAVMRKAVDQVADWPGVRVSLSRHRGDGWQLVLSQPRFALRACMFIRAALRGKTRGFDTRIATGVAEAGSLRWDAPGASDGPAFRLSGLLLDDLRNPVLMDVRLGDGLDAPAELLSPMFALCDALSWRWTEKQAVIAAMALSPVHALSQEDIARRLGVARPTVAVHERKAGVRAMLNAIEAFEDLDIWQAKTRVPRRAASDA